jgi:predicted nuclease of predicted toxin-antitoxin system
MNLPPAWVGVFESTGISARHWVTIGAPTATDQELMAWARDNGFVVFTHDLDYGALLAATRATAPSVIQLRTSDVLPEAVGERVLGAIRLLGEELQNGAIVTIDLSRARVRVLPLSRSST